MKDTSNNQKDMKEISRKKKQKRRINILLIAMILPAIIWYIIFCYVPMGGIVLAFKNYRYDMGIFGSPWVGLDNFRQMFKDRAFIQAFKNTLIFSGGKLIFHFPIPIIIAILLNEVKNARFKKFFQTIFTLPHFISWVVLANILMNLFSSGGLVNQILSKMHIPPFSPTVTPHMFRPFIWTSNLWKEFGWDSIIYLAALTSIDPTLYEAAQVDGANRFQRMLSVTLPGIKNVIFIMLILQIGTIMGGAPFNQIFNLYSPAVYGVGDILDTYVARYTFEMGANFGYTTAVGLLKSVIGVTMISISNYIVTKSGGQGLF